MGIAAILLVSTLMLFAISMPIAFALGLGSLVVIFLEGKIPLIILAQKVVSGIDSFPLLAIPFFFLAAALMNEGGLTQDIVNTFNALLGRFRGSLALVNVGSNMFMAGISGSSVADASALGSVLIPAMKDEGYDKEFSAAITASASICGPIIPPSIPLIIYGVSARVSIIGLYLGGIIPGVMLGLMLGLGATIISRRREYPKHAPTPWRDAMAIVARSGFALVMPVLLLVGIIGAVFTVTELAAAAVVYALIVGGLVYRRLSFARLLGILRAVALDTAIIMFVVGTSTIFSYVLALYQIPQMIPHFILSLTQSKLVILLIVNAFLLVAGMFLDSTPATIILVPVFLPLVRQVGMDPLHFGVVMVFNLMMGLLTPPVAMSLYVATTIAKCEPMAAFREVLPFFAIMLVILMLITYIPWLVMGIPNALMG